MLRDSHKLKSWSNIENAVFFTAFIGMLLFNIYILQSQKTLVVSNYVIPIGILTTIFLWFGYLESWRKRIFASVIIIISIAVIIAEQFFFTIDLLNTIPSLIVLGISVIIVAVNPLIFYFSGILSNKVLHNKSTVQWNTHQLTKSGNGVPPFFWISIIVTVCLAISGMYFTSIFRRPGIVGWDTASYVWRSRVINQENGLINLITGYDNGLQFVFAGLSSGLHRLTGWSFWDVVQILPVFLVIIGCLSQGILVFTATRSKVAMISSILFTASFFTTARFVADLRDNLTVWMLGASSIALFSLIPSISKRRTALLVEVASGICLTLTGFAHIAMAPIFFLVMGLVSVYEFFDWRWQNSVSSLKLNLRSFIKFARVPLVSMLVFGGGLIPILPTYLHSINQFGIDTSALGSSTSFNLNWLIDNLMVLSYLPWVILGGMASVIAFFLPSVRENRPYRLALTWVIISFCMWLFLPGRLAYRYFMMIPFPILVGLGLHEGLKFVLRLPGFQKVISTIAMFVIVFGLILPKNIVNNYKTINERQVWVTEAMLIQMNYVNQYIERYHLTPPYVFIVQRERDGTAFSFLWLNIIRATVEQSAILDSYLYYGNLDKYLAKQPTDYQVPEANWPSNYWWSILQSYKIVDNTNKTTFILQEFNPAYYPNYLFNPNIDLVAPGVLVVLEESQP